MLVRKDNAAEEETTGDKSLYHYHNQCIHVTDGVTVLSLSASLLQKIRAVTGCLCQIALTLRLQMSYIQVVTGGTDQTLGGCSLC